MGRPEGGGTAPPRSPGVFPQSSAALAMNQARLSEEQGCWSCVCVSGGRQATAQREGRSLQAGAPCWRPPLTAPESLAGWAPAQDTGTCHPVSTQGTPAHRNQSPGEGVTREQELLQGRMLRACGDAPAPGLSSCQGPG